MVGYHTAKANQMVYTDETPGQLLHVTVVMKQSGSQTRTCQNNAYWNGSVLICKNTNANYLVLILNKNTSQIYLKEIMVF